MKKIGIIFLLIATVASSKVWAVDEGKSRLSDYEQLRSLHLGIYEGVTHEQAIEVLQRVYNGTMTISDYSELRLLPWGIHGSLTHEQAVEIAERSYKKK